MKTTSSVIAAIALVGTVLFGQHVQPTQEQSPIDQIAESYVKLTLAVGQHDSEYVDSYFGPAIWREEAAVRKASLAEIRERVLHTLQELAGIDTSRLGEVEKLRTRYLYKQIESIKARLDLLAGVEMKFDKESAELLDAVAPDYPDAHFEAKLAHVDTLLPGTGSLRERYEKFRLRFLVPKEKVEAVFRMAMEEARLCTRRFIQLPEGENIRVEVVSDKPWTAYSRYVGNGQSVVQLNTDVRYTVDELLLIACHEGYPGHHVSSLLFEERLVHKRGWIEFSVSAFPSVLMVITEGTACDALAMAFPLPERVSLERDKLYPLAGLDAALADSAALVFDLTESLSSPWLADASPVAARLHLDGFMDRSKMLDWLKTRTLVPVDQLEVIGKFISNYRSYIICYSVGLDLVRHHIDKYAGENRERQWQEFERLQTPPMLPSELR